MDLDPEGTAALGLLLHYIDLIKTDAPEHEVAACLQELRPLLDAIPGTKGADLREHLRAAETRAVKELVHPPPTAGDLLAQMEAAFAADAPREVIQDLRQAIKRERHGDTYAPEMERANEIMREMNKRRRIR